MPTDHTSFFSALKPETHIYIFLGLVTVISGCSIDGLSVKTHFNEYERIFVYRRGDPDRD